MRKMKENKSNYPYQKAVNLVIYKKILERKIKKDK